MNAKGPVDPPKRVLIVGAGAVGCTLAGWLAPEFAETYLLATPRLFPTLKARGIVLYPMDAPGLLGHARPRVVSDATQAPKPDLVLVCVKNYSLDQVCAELSAKIGDPRLVIGLQNGIENQAILPRYFSRVAYGVVLYNAWVDEPGVVGYQKRGPIALGTPDNSLQEELRAALPMVGRACETLLTTRFQDAIHTKMVVNLANSLTTLVGHGIEPLSDRALFQQLLAELAWEGVTIVRAAGYGEARMGGMPSWRLIKAAARLPGIFTRRAFDRNLKKLVRSSMTQDLRSRGPGMNELEGLNGYFVRMADHHGLAAPVNRAVYELCRERFMTEPFQPMDVRDVWTRVSRA